MTFTGNPPLDHDAAWAKMEVINVEGKKVNATFYSRLANGTALSIVEDLNFETGRLIDLFIIPAGLKTGEIFYDHTVGQIAIDATEIRTYAGAARTVVHAEAVDTQWYWDKATGVTLEARTSNSIYTLDTIAVSTGLWGPQILGLDQTVFYGLTILLVTVAIAATIVVITYRRRKTRLSKL